MPRLQAWENWPYPTSEGRVDRRVSPCPLPPPCRQSDSDPQQLDMSILGALHERRSLTGNISPRMGRMRPEGRTGSSHLLSPLASAPAGAFFHCVSPLAESERERGQMSRRETVAKVKLRARICRIELTLATGMDHLWLSFPGGSFGGQSLTGAAHSRANGRPKEVGAMLRREDRKALDLSARLKTSAFRMEVKVSDISEYGCRLNEPWIYLQKGDRVSLKPELFGSLFATVKWANSSQVGIEFDSPLHSAVVDHLCSMHPKQSESRKFSRLSDIAPVPAQLPRRMV
jgi:hypothetical protein